MKLGFVGASGYGNTGDDTYPLVLSDLLPEAELVFFNSDLPETLPSDLDALILGGGGLIYNLADVKGGPGPHFRCMQFYMNAAMARGIPWGFLSCGVQFDVDRDAHFTTDLAPWVPYLQKASFVSLRSRECVRMVTSLTGREEGVHCFPDLAYLFRPSIPEAAAGSTTPVVTLIPAGLVNPRNRHTQHMLRHFRGMGCELVWMNMGAPVDDAGHLDEAARLDPTARMIRNPSPAEAFAQIGRSQLVLTGRYHGMIFARSQKVPYYVPEYAPHKIRHEPLDMDPKEAACHLTVLKTALAECLRKLPLLKAASAEAQK